MHALALYPLILKAGQSSYFIDSNRCLRSLMAVPLVVFFFFFFLNLKANCGIKHGRIIHCVLHLCSETQWK